MISKKVVELVNWLESKTRKIDQPRNLSYDEVIDLIEISEIELIGNKEILEKKIIEFKNNYEYPEPK